MEEERRITYTEAMKAGEKAKSAKALCRVAEMFSGLDDYQNSKEESRRFWALTESARKKRNVFIAISSTSVIAAITIHFVITQAIMPSNKYNNAMELRTNGDLAGAKAAFSELDDYKDSNRLVRDIEGQILYEKAEGLLAAGNYNGAASAFKEAKQCKNIASSLKYLDWQGMLVQFPRLCPNLRYTVHFPYLHECRLLALHHAVTVPI